MIYLDMDGVLADFDQALLDNGIKNCKTFMHLSKTVWTKEQTELSHSVMSMMSKPGFFRGLPPMLGYKELWDYCSQYGHKVLTAIPGDGISGNRVIEEKKDWLLWHIGNFNQEDFISCLRPEKSKYAHGFHMDGQYPHILVDDMESNCSEWEKAGGKAILFTSSEQSIKELKKLIGN